jgi:tetratricopeptide (TPR) repeat protein
VDRPGYSAFLSYSHRDARWGTWLHRSLESYRVPKRLVGTVTERGEIPRRLAPVFRDREELASSTDLSAVINEALTRSGFQIVICSPRAAQSRWVNEEILAFKRLGREDRILCLIVDGEPNASDNPLQAQLECFPPALRFRLGADGNLSTTRTEPIAADARPSKDGRNNAKLKLIAGVLGLGFNALKQREQQRRQRQLLAITTAALAGMVLTTGLATVALMARATARGQTIRAEAETVRAEAEAESARRATTFLVDLFRIFDPSEARGNSVTAREMLEKGAGRIETELARQPAIQATLMDTVGTVYMGLGLYDQARPLLEGAVARRRKATDPGPLSESLNRLGELLTLRAEYAGAEKSYREAIALHGVQPRNPQLQAAHAKSLYGLGVLLGRQGRYEDAEKTLREALARQRELHSTSSGEVASTLQNLARVVDQNGDLNAALPLMKSAVAMQRELRGTLPHPDLAEAINDLGLLEQGSGDYETAEKLFHESLDMKRKLLGNHHPEIAMGLNNLANVLQDKGDLVQAESVYGEALAMQRDLLGEVHPDVANTLNNLAFVQYDRGDTAGALVTEGQSLEVYQKLFPGDHPEVARIMNRIGYWLTQAGQYDEAGRDLQEALAMRRRLLGKNHPDVASSLTHLAILQVATGRFSEAYESAASATRISTAALSASHWRTAVAESAQGAALAGLGRYADAEPLLTHSYGVLSKDAGALPMYRALSRSYLEQLYRQWGRPREARLYGAIKVHPPKPQR